MVSTSDFDRTLFGLKKRKPIVFKPFWLCFPSEQLTTIGSGEVEYAFDILVNSTVHTQMSL